MWWIGLFTSPGGLRIVGVAILIIALFVAAFIISRPRR
jgi:hypothetical protein